LSEILQLWSTSVKTEVSAVLYDYRLFPTRHFHEGSATISSKYRVQDSLIFFFIEHRQASIYSNLSLYM
jgi:hypothetical protein